MLFLDLILDARKSIKQNNAQKNDETQHVVVDGKYSIDVPVFLSETTKLGEDASLQYWNKTLDVTFMVVDEPKAEFAEALKDVDELSVELGNSSDNGGADLLSDFAAVSISNMFEMDDISIERNDNIQINGLKAKVVNVFQKRTFFKDAVYGIMAYVEGKNTLYQIIILIGGTSIKKLAEKMEECVYTFKEL